MSPGAPQGVHNPLWQIPPQQSSERLHRKVLHWVLHVPLKHVPLQQRLLISHACPSSPQAVQAPLVQFSLQHSLNDEQGPPPRVHGVARPPVPTDKPNPAKPDPFLPPVPKPTKPPKLIVSDRSVSPRSASKPFPDELQPTTNSSAAATQAHAFRTLIAGRRLSRLPRRLVYRLAREP
jgi:hypothetical protein